MLARTSAGLESERRQCDPRLWPEMAAAAITRGAKPFDADQSILKKATETSPVGDGTRLLSPERSRQSTTRYRMQHMATASQARTQGIDRWFRATALS